MFVNINAYSCAGLEHNEDAVYTAEGLLIVMDGASGLNGIHRTDAPTDACWLSHTAVALLAEKLNASERSIAEALEETAEALRQGLAAFGYPEEPELYPSGSLMIARRLGGEIELYTLGDCTALIRWRDGRPVCCCHDAAVTRLDNAVLTRAQKLADNCGGSVAQALPELRSYVVENRRLRNREGGYWIFDPSGRGIAHGQRLLLPAGEVHSLALMSDGFYDIAQLEGGPTHEELMTLLENTPAAKLVEGLYEALEADPLLDRLPRFKLKDDATVAYARVEP